MENLKIKEDLSDVFPIDLVFMKQEQIQNMIKNMQSSHGHSHNGKPCDGNHGHSPQSSHGHSHSHGNHGHSHGHNHDEEDECEDDHEDHGHSHNKGHGHSHDHGHSHSKGNDHGHSHSKGHGHSHGHDEEDECEDDHEDHGHSHNKGHGHSHDHGHSHSKGNDHGHSHDNKEHGHSHGNHGHSHNGKPCDGNHGHQKQLVFKLNNLSTTTLLNVSKLKQYLSNEKKKSRFEEWWKEQKKNQTAKGKLEKRLSFLLESVKQTGEIEESQLKNIAPFIFEVDNLLGEESKEIKVVEERPKELIALMNYFINLNESSRKTSSSELVTAFLQIMTYCAVVIPLIEEATEEALLPAKSLLKNFNKVCDKHKEQYLVHPYTCEWVCFQCFPSEEDVKVGSTIFRFQNFYDNQIANVSGEESVCKDENCKYCPNFLTFGIHEKRGMLRVLSDKNEIICPGCGKQTGKQRSGLMLLSIEQYHGEDCKDKRYQNKTPKANCGCKVHTHFFLICSIKCHKKLELPFNEQTKNLYSQASQRIVTFTNGPLAIGCAHYNSKGEELSFEINPNKSNVDNTCNVCGKSDTRACGRCKSTYYCSVECQKKDWPNHKNICKSQN